MSLGRSGPRTPGPPWRLDALAPAPGAPWRELDAFGGYGEALDALRAPAAPPEPGTLFRVVELAGTAGVTRWLAAALPAGLALVPPGVWERLEGFAGPGTEDAAALLGRADGADPARVTLAAAACVRLVLPPGAGVLRWGVEGAEDRAYGAATESWRVRVLADHARVEAEVAGAPRGYAARAVEALASGVGLEGEDGWHARHPRAAVAWAARAGADPAALGAALRRFLSPADAVMARHAAGDFGDDGRL